MKPLFTAVFEQVPEGHIGYVEESPGANTQGATLDEARVHSVLVNRAAGNVATIPRHQDVNDFLARKICRDLEVAEP